MILFMHRQTEFIEDEFELWVAIAKQLLKKEAIVVMMSCKCHPLEILRPVVDILNDGRITVLRWFLGRLWKLLQ